MDNQVLWRASEVLELDFHQSLFHNNKANNNK